MKRKIFLIGLSITLTLMLCACNGKTTETNKFLRATTAPKSTPKVTASPSPTPAVMTTQCYSIKKANNYSEDKAWIRFTDKNTDESYWGVIDKSGKLIFKILDAYSEEIVYVKTGYNHSSIKETVDFKNGFGYVICKDCCIVIDSSGKETHRFITDDKNELKAYGDGYTVIEHCESGFDELTYTYRIFDSIGNMIQEYTPEDKKQHDVDYCGEGVFRFCINYDHSEYKVYFVKTNQWADHKMDGNYIRFHDDYQAFYIKYLSPKNTDTDPRGILTLINSEGNTKNVNLYRANGWNWNIYDCGVSEGVCILDDVINDNLVAYNISEDKIYMLDQKYVKKRGSYSDRSDYEKYPMLIHDGVIPIPMEGEDHNRYTGIFDSKLNLVTEPILGTCIDNFSDKRLVIKRGDYSYVYDTSGTLIFSTENMKYSEISGYSNGAAKVLDEELESSIPVYLDVNGNVLFDNIDISDVSIIKYPASSQ